MQVQCMTAKVHGDRHIERAERRPGSEKAWERKG